MSSFIWGLLSFVAGWSMQSLFCRSLPGQPFDDLIERIKDAVQPRPFGIPTNGGSQQVPDELRVLILLSGVVIALALFFIAASQLVAYQPGFNFEEFLATERIVLLIVWIILGFIASAYRSQLCDLFIILFNVLSTKENTILWPVQAAVGIGLFVGTLLAVNPQLIEKLTSVKAGGVEANFGRADARISTAPVRLLAVSKSLSGADWSRFAIRNIKWSCISDNLREGYNKQACVMDEKKSMYRDEMYRAAEVDWKQVAFAQKIFDEQISPAFAVLNDEKTPMIERTYVDLIDGFATDISNTIILSLTDENDKDKTVKRLNEMRCRYKLLFEEGVKINKVHEDAERRDQIHDEQAQIQNNEERNSIGLDKLVYSDDRGHIVWDLYVVAAIADLLNDVKGERVGAEFLERVRLLDLNRFASCKNKCKYLIPSITSFYYNMTDAKIKSGEPWPFEEMKSDIEFTLENVKYIQSRESEIQKTLGLSSGQIDDLRVTYKKTYLQDLAVGLEVFYQRALSGDVLDPADLQLWRSWLTETRQILSALESVGDVHGLADESQWQKAAQNIRESNLVTFFDAASSVALSLVLLPRQTGAPNSSDCLAARSNLNYVDLLMDRQDFKDQIHEQQHPERTQLVRGFVADIKGRVTAECAE